MPMPMPARWNPFRQLSRFEPFSEFDDLVRGMGMRPTSQMEGGLDLRMDVSEDDKGYRIKVDMPGVRKEDIDVSLEGNQVTINAEIGRETSRENEREIYSERYAGKIFRSFALPSEVDSTKSEAHYDNGVLVLTLPKMATAQSRHLSVN